MAKYVHQASIDTPIERVWEILSDFGGIYRYSPMVTVSSGLTAHNPGVGAERSCDVFLGMGKTRERILHWEEGNRYELEIYQMSRMPIERALVTFQIIPDGNRTTVTSTMEPFFKFGAAGKLLGVTMGPILERMFATVVAGLKHYAETGEEVQSMKRLDMLSVQIQ